MTASPPSSFLSTQITRGSACHHGAGPPPISAHAQLSSPLCSLPAPLPPYPIPHRCSPMGETEEGFLFQYHERRPPLQVSDWRAWGCLSVASVVEHTNSDH